MTGPYPPRLRASRLDGGAPTYYPASPLTKERERERERRRKEKKDRNRKERLATPASMPHFGGNFSMSVAARKSITALSHISMENSSDTCARRHRPAFQPVAFPTSFQSSRCWCFHRLQCRRRCSRFWATVPPHHQHLSSSRCPNRFR